MRSPQLTKGKYLVVRQFGQTSIRWTRSGVCSNRWFNYVRFYEIRSIFDDYSARLIMKRKLQGDGHGRMMPLVWFGRHPFFLDLLLGRPRLYVVDTWEQAVMKAGSLELDEAKILVKATNWMPRRMQRYVVMAVLALIDGFFVTRAYAQAMREV